MNMMSLRKMICLVVCSGLGWAGSLSADMVLDWNGYAANSIVVVAGLTPARGQIRLAMVHTAIYDAVNAIAGYPFHPYGVMPNVVTPASPEAASLLRGGHHKIVIPRS